MLGPMDANISHLPDMVHKLWRCIWNGTRKAGHFSQALFTGVVVTLERGPYEGSNHQSLLQTGADDLSSFELFKRNSCVLA